MALALTQSSSDQSLRFGLLDSSSALQHHRRDPALRPSSKAPSAGPHWRLGAPRDETHEMGAPRTLDEGELEARLSGKRSGRTSPPPIAPHKRLLLDDEGRPLRQRGRASQEPPAPHASSAAAAAIPITELPSMASGVARSPSRSPSAAQRLPSIAQIDREIGTPWSSDPAAYDGERTARPSLALAPSQQQQQQQHRQGSNQPQLSPSDSFFARPYRGGSPARGGQSDRDRMYGAGPSRRSPSFAGAREEAGPYRRSIDGYPAPPKWDDGSNGRFSAVGSHDAARRQSASVRGPGGEGPRSPPPHPLGLRRSPPSGVDEREQPATTDRSAPPSRRPTLIGPRASDSLLEWRLTSARPGMGPSTDDDVEMLRRDDRGEDWRQRMDGAHPLRAPSFPPASRPGQPQQGWTSGPRGPDDGISFRRGGDGYGAAPSISPEQSHMPPRLITGGFAPHHPSQHTPSSSSSLDQSSSRTSFSHSFPTPHRHSTSTASSSHDTTMMSGGGYSQYDGPAASPAQRHMPPAGHYYHRDSMSGVEADGYGHPSHGFGAQGQPHPAYGRPVGWGHPQQYQSGGYPVDGHSSAMGAAARRRGKLPRQVTDFLKTWLLDHASHPYPTEEEKRMLCDRTGLSISQVSNWFINARRRILIPQSSGGFAIGPGAGGDPSRDPHRSSYGSPSSA